MRLLKSFADFFELHKSNSFIISCSGGVDSQVLLYLALKFFDHDKIQVIYFDHSKRLDTWVDIAMIKNLLIGTSVKFSVVKVDLGSDLAKYSRRMVTPLWDLNSNQVSKQSSFQALSSNFRYNYLQSICSKTGSLILTAHHLDDQTESLLMNLSVKASYIGLTPMMSGEFRIIRPFLDLNIKKSEILSFANGYRISFNLDSSNLELLYKRNLFRYYLSSDLFSSEFVKSLNLISLENSRVSKDRLEFALTYLIKVQGFYVLDLDSKFNDYLLEIFYLLFGVLSKGVFSEFCDFIDSAGASKIFSYNSVNCYKSKNAVFFTCKSFDQIVSDLFGSHIVENSNVCFAREDMRFFLNGTSYSYKRFFRKLDIPVFLRKYTPVVLEGDNEFKLYSKSLILSVYKNFIKLA